jgi:hypothetical protein
MLRVFETSGLEGEATYIFSNTDLLLPTPSGLCNERKAQTALAASRALFSRGGIRPAGDAGEKCVAHGAAVGRTGAFCEGRCLLRATTRARVVGEHG